MAINQEDSLEAEAEELNRAIVPAAGGNGQ
jgi:hypothetical protein